MSSLPDGPAGAVDDAGTPAFDPSLAWKVVHQSDDRVDLVRELDEPVDMLGGDVRTHASRSLELVTDDGLRVADLLLAEAPAPDDTAVDLLVQERGCASGQSAEGRVEIVELTETADEVQLRIGVRPPDADVWTCPGNPSTPFTVKLNESLGDRKIVDVSVVPPRPVTVAGDR